MGCGSSQTTEMSSYRTRAAAYGDLNEPSTTLSSVDHRSEPEGREYDDIGNDTGGSAPQIQQQRFKPQAEYWAHTPLPSSSQPPPKRPVAKGPEPCAQHPGHTISDRRTRSTKAEPSDRQAFFEPGSR